MSGPPDPALAARFLEEFEMSVDAYSEVNPRVLGGALYLARSVLQGMDNDFEPEEYGFDYNVEVRKAIDALPCRPLLQPYLEAREWSADEVTALRVKFTLRK
jgi:hypothetical protein